MSINKYTERDFAQRLRDNYPHQYSSSFWSDERIVEDWIKVNPEDIAHLTAGAQNKFINYDIGSNRYSFKRMKADDELIIDPNQSLANTKTAGLKRFLFSFPQLITQMPGWFTSIPAQTREAFDFFQNMAQEWPEELASTSIGMGPGHVVNVDPAKVQANNSNPNTASELPGQEIDKMFNWLSPIADASLNASEYMRKTADGWANNYIANDPHLAAYYAWKDENPYSIEDFKDNPIRAVKNGVIDMAPSVIMMMSPGGIARVGVGASRMFNSAKATKAFTTMQNASNSLGLGVMFAMEGGSTYNETMGFLVDEQGMKPEDATGLAGSIAALYAPVSTYLEKLQFNAVTRMLGISKQADKFMISGIANAITKKAGGIQAIRKLQGANALANYGSKLLDISVNTFEQGVVEGWQETWNTVLSESIKQGYGSNANEANDEMWRIIGKNLGQQSIMPWKSDEKHVRESFFSALFGSFAPGGVSVFSSSRKSYKRYLSGLQAAEGAGFDVKVNGTRVEIYDKEGVLYSVYEAGSEDAANESAQNFKEEIQKEAVTYWAAALDEDGDLDDILADVDIDIESDSFSTIEGYAKNLALQLTDTITDLNSWFKPSKGQALNDVEQLVVDDAEGNDNNIGRKALNLIKLAKNVNVFRDAGISDDIAKELESAAIVALNTLTSNALMKRLAKGKNITLATMDKALLAAKPSEILSHVAEGTYMSDLVPKLLKDANIKVRDLPKKKLTKENADEFNKALEEEESRILSEPDGNSIDNQRLNKLENKVENIDFSNINSNKLSINQIKDYIQYTAMKSGSLGLRDTLLKLDKTRIYKLAKALNIKATKKDVSTNENQVLEAIAQSIMGNLNPISQTSSQTKQSIETKDDKPTKPKKTTRKISKSIDEMFEEVVEDRAAISAQINAFKNKLNDKRLGKKTLKDIKTAISALEVKLNAIEAAAEFEQEAEEYLSDPGAAAKINNIVNEFSTLEAEGGDISAYLQYKDIPTLEILSSNIDDPGVKSRIQALIKEKTAEDTGVAQEPSEAEVQEAETQKEIAKIEEFIEEGEDDGWGIPDKTSISAEESAELDKIIGSQIKQDGNNKNSQTKSSGKTSAQKAEDRTEDEICWD